MGLKMRGGATELSGEASQSLVLCAHVDALVWADVLGAKSPGPEREALNGVDGARAVHTGQGLGLAEDGEGTRPRQEPKPRTGRRGPEVTARAQAGSVRQLVGPCARQTGPGVPALPGDTRRLRKRAR